MATLFERVQQFFSDESWPAEVVEPATLKLEWRGENAEWICIARVREAYGQVMFYSLAPFTVPEEHRAAIAELLMRINGRIVAGNLEIDLRDGELRYRTSFDVGPDGHDALDIPAMVGRLVGANVKIMDHYLPAVIAVLNGEAPATARENADRAMT
jgi:hypothetical protein